ncbi:glycosyltransferase [Mycobacterium sp. 663a-19]|uniref:glycosyltransferase n=1 Tax=Mycobacterium sp. 663a-19 TaxID=2986148 RepID=UPI002D1F2FF9|nr:glycosyltransferase [Mycobacterium sp. 663a-19]MEB3983928.1 glycosyltransferase [Mycobacterium sp. 663a-19]
MRFVLASYGSRGDVEPCAAVGRELLRRGHDVRVAVAPDLVGFVESAGLPAVAYGLATSLWIRGQRDFETSLSRHFWKINELIRSGREAWRLFAQCWEEISTTLMPLAEGVDVLVTGLAFEGPAANVAERRDIALATLHTFPSRANGRGLRRSAGTVVEWVVWRLWRKVEDAQRRQLGLPKATGPWPWRIIGRGSLEIQAYEQACFPELAAEWADSNGPNGPQRPFVGALTMELPTEADEEVLSWIAAGTPPIYFGFGSMPVESATDTSAMVGAACAELGVRALVCAGWTDFSDVPSFEHVKVVGAVNHSAIFPACRAVVHHGGAGTTAAGLRAGVPTLILWILGDQPRWAAVVKQLKVGSGRRLSSTTTESLVADLRTILAPRYVTRARELATRITKPAESVAAAADLLEDFAHSRRVG